MARQTATQTRTETERRGAADGTGAPAPQPAPRLSQQEKLDELGRFLARLTQVKDWLIEDPRMLPVVDAFIGEQVAQMAVKARQWNVRFALVTMVVGALLGWLLSAVGTPGTLAHLFVH